jgi:mRNA-degrading endonuclease RelE of RelBE toxin-antitoxin system
VSYRVIWSRKAEDHFRRLDKPARERVCVTVEKLARNPRPTTAESIVGMPGVLRVRNGDYRVLYCVDDEQGMVWIEDVRHRSKAYGGH